MGVNKRKTAIINGEKVTSNLSFFDDLFRIADVAAETYKQIGLEDLFKQSKRISDDALNILFLNGYYK